GLCLAALAAPYCFAPRPMSRSLPRPLPLVVALTVLAAGAVLVRKAYGSALFASLHGLGIDLGIGVSPGEMALFLMALATLAWTVASCALSESGPRRDLGAGLALVALGGYGFEWPLAFVLSAAGLVTIADALPRLGHAAERGKGPRTPPIDDAVWQTYVTGLIGGLRARGDKVTAVTTRGEDDLQATGVGAGRGGATRRAP